MWLFVGHGASMWLNPAHCGSLWLRVAHCGTIRLNVAQCHMERALKQIEGGLTHNEGAAAP